MDVLTSYRRLNESHPLRVFARRLRRRLALVPALANRIGDQHSAAILYREELAAGHVARAQRHAASIDFKRYADNGPQRLHDLTAIERGIYLEVEHLCAQSADAVTQLARAVEHIVQNDIPGDLIECGVYRGGSIIVMARVLQLLSATRTIWAYDTYEGMPEPQAIDEHWKQTPEEDGGLKSWALRKRNDGSGGSDWVYCPIDEVKKNIAVADYPDHLIHYVKGKVEDTIPIQAPKQIAVLRLDTDFYASTRHELEQLFPRLVSGGVLIIDDYGGYAGSRAATDEYFTGKKVMLARVDANVRMYVKP